MLHSTSLTKPIFAFHGSISIDIQQLSDTGYGFTFGCALHPKAKHQATAEHRIDYFSKQCKIKDCFTTYQEVKENVKQKQIEKQLRPLAYKVHTLARVTVEQSLILPDFYNTYKEKIPSHLIFERFLI